MPTNRGEDGYRAQQARSFAYVGTDASEWVACEIIGMDDEDKPIYDEPADYETVSPYSEMMTKDEVAAAQARIASGGWKTLCELCGHGIMNPCPIKHDGKQLLMYVGSECVNNFMGAGYYQMSVKLFRDKKLRQLFKIWLSIAIQDCYAFKDRNGKMPYEIYRLKEKLSDIRDLGEDELASIATRKIKAIFRQAGKLGISAPKVTR